jgi:hypothetical protein
MQPRGEAVGAGVCPGQQVRKLRASRPTVMNKRGESSSSLMHSVAYRNGILMMGIEVICMKRLSLLAVSGLLVVLVLAAAADASTFFNRGTFIQQVRTAFHPLEGLLPEGDELDYETAVFFSGVLNDSDEHLVVVRLTSDSVSVENARRLRTDLTWEDVGKLPLFAIMVLPPTDCIREVEYNIPYLVRSLSWDTAEAVDASGRFVRDVETWWEPEVNQGVWFKFSGNILVHLETCTTASMNQV